MYLDYLTKNQSFHEVSRVLRNSGVKNNTFMFRRHRDPAMECSFKLGVVDPFSNDLSDTMRAAIRNEVRCNIWYYFQKFGFYKIGSELKEFELTKQSAAQIYLYTKEKSQWITSHKQSYKTGVALDIALWHLFVSQFAENHDLTIISNKFKSHFTGNGYYTNLLYSKISALPKYIIRYSGKYWQHVLDDHVLELDPRQYIRDAEDAYRFGNSVVSNLVIIDDAESIPHIDKILAGMLDRNKEMEKEQVVMLLSTVNDHDDAVKNGVFDALKMFTRWEDGFYDKEKLPGFGMHVQYNWAEAWYEKMKQTLNNPDIIKREIDCVR